MNYYYFAASLPSVTLDAAPPLSLAQFLNRCREHLNADDLAAVRLLAEGADSPAPHAFVQAWLERETLLRNALVRIRAARLRCEAAPYLHPIEASDSSLDKAVADALARPTPLERELELDRVRWNQAAQLAGFNPFSMDALFAYTLKLKLAERWASLNEQAGRDKIHAIETQPPTAASAT